MDTNEIKGQAARQSKWLRDEMLLCLRRVIRSDFQTEHATDIEREALASADEPILNPMVQDFVAWRRSVLWIAALLLACYAVFEVLSYKTFEQQMEPTWSAQYDAQKQAIEQQFGDWQPPEMISKSDFIDQELKAFGADNAEIIDGFEAVLTSSVVVAAVMVVIAAMRWRSVRTSRKWSRIGWLVMFGAPMLLLMLPVTSMMNFDHIPDEQMREARKMMVGGNFAVMAFIVIAPKAIALFPGIIRSSMSLKTLVPESAAPGWIAAIMAPFYAVFLVLIVSVINQVHGDLLLVSGLACYMIGPLVFVWKAESMVRPHTAQETTTIVSSVRRQASLFTVIGTVLLAIFLVRLPMFSVMDALSFMAGVVGNVLLMTVVAADLILALLYYGYKQNRAFAGTELEASLDQKFNALAEVGFTRIRSIGGGKTGEAVTKNASADESTDA